MWNEKINRAKQHQQQLKSEIDRFIASNPYTVATRRDKATRGLVYYISSAKDVPDSIALVTGDILQNLRSALDHLAYALFSAGSRSDVPGKHIYFPIAESLEKYEASKGSKTRGISSKAIRMIDEQKPYREGNERLWQLHELNLTDKHRLLVTVGSAYQSVDIGSNIMKSFPRLEDIDGGLPLQLPELSLFIKPADNLFPLRVGDELFMDQPDAQEDASLRFGIELVLSEPGIIEGESLTRALDSIIEAVEQTISAVEPVLK